MRLGSTDSAGAKGWIAGSHPKAAADDAAAIAKGNRMFDRARTIWPGCPVGRYLRDVRRLAGPYDPRSLRWLPRWGDWPPVLLMLIRASGGEWLGVEALYVLDDGTDKANGPNYSQFTFGRKPPGSSVWLGDVAEVMGVAESVITALSASKKSGGMPVDAVLGKGGLRDWRPRHDCKRVIIFGDHDEHGGGQTAAKALEGRLLSDGFGVEVRIPDEVGDWNDMLKPIAAAAAGRITGPKAVVKGRR